MAPELHVPLEPLSTQLRPLSHWSGAEHGLLALPSVHEPSLALAWLLPQNPLWQSWLAVQLEPSAPSLQSPSAPGSDALPTQTPLLQSDCSKQAAPLSPSLQVPTKDVAGRMQSRAAPQ
jgi:hypothetical protein